MFEFIETSYFSRYRDKYLDDEQLRALQSALGNDPEIGDVMPGCGGARKMRWPTPDAEKENEAG